MYPPSRDVVSISAFEVLLGPDIKDSIAIGTIVIFFNYIIYIKYKKYYIDHYNTC